ncbi:MAG: hypothetical protein RLZZ230_922, partial [Candidatus Parcubacteria bacterium]
MWDKGAIIVYMSILSNKSVLIIGDTDSVVVSIEDLLVKHGMQVQTVSCDTFSAQVETEHSPDLILLNHPHITGNCSSVMTQLHASEFYQFIPLFILTKDANFDVDEILNYAASDYISADESLESILNKVKNIFSYGNAVSTDSAIDITPKLARTTTSGIKVYVVEDDPLLRNLLSTRLEKSSFPHEFSVSAEGALWSMKQFVPDVIILDLMLPGKNGFELLAEIREDGQFKDTPVIIFSNRDSQEDRRKA